MITIVQNVCVCKRERERERERGKLDRLFFPIRPCVGRDEKNFNLKVYGIDMLTSI